MRANRSGLRLIASRCADSLGAYSAWIAFFSSLFSTPARLKNTREVRLRISPDFSSGRMVFSKVAGSSLLAIASISARCSSMPRSKAGPKWLSWILSKCG